MPGYANVKRHHSAEMTLLCPTHHAEKTRGLLSESQVVEANGNPFNRRSGATSPFALRFSGDSPEIQMAQQRFTCSDKRRPTWMIPIMVERHAPLGFTVDTLGLMLNLEAIDSRGWTILRIRDSEMVISTAVLDVQLVGPHFTINDNSDRFALGMSFSPPNKIAIDRYRCVVKAITIDVQSEEIRFSRANQIQLTVAGNGKIDANVGVLYGEAPRGFGVGIRAG
jgi:hypothetical protein